jgi:enamine deaminase RidA (YjgF/YER057c/UK114 family)
MHANIDRRIAQLGIELPNPAPAVGSYVPFVLVGGLLLVAGQLPVWNGTLKHDGRVGAEITLEDGIAAARLCGLNLLAQVRAACGGDLDRVHRVVRLAGFVQAGPGFTEHVKVLNGASDLMVEVFGQAGRHTRVAVGAASLPLGAAVEVEGMFEIG